ncbi:PQQ-binding-like beta-propeller repeat protein [Streptomyces sp. NPDC050842]|uniref:outer membrane protein assembly factor BamB family protein n=1 Tax=Streptomyces sp. NPDC050842 TaxID=3365636 RepID=UPI0037B6A089
MTERTDEGRSGAVRRYGWRGRLGCLAAVVVPLALVVGIAWAFLHPMGWVPGWSMTTTWVAKSDAAEAAPEDAADRTWVAGDLVVRGRPDGVRAFHAGSGAKRWEYTPPRLTDICALSATADDSVALVAYTGRGGGCATVAALDLKDGRELWHASRVPALDAVADQGLLPGQGPLTGRGFLGVGGALAVADGLGLVLEAGGDAPALRALELRTGAPRWTAAVPKGCEPGPTATAPKQVLTVLTCGGEMKLAAFAPADGTALWTVPLDARRGVTAGTAVSVVSAEPIVLRVDGRDFLAFGPDGRPGPRIKPGGAPSRLDGADVAVSDGRLFALTKGGRWGRIVGYDLTSGDQLWQEGLGGAGYTVGGLYAGGGRVMALRTSTRSGNILHTFDAATGDEEQRVFRELASPAQEVIPLGELLIAVHPGDDNRPFSAYERW